MLLCPQRMFKSLTLLQTCPKPAQLSEDKSYIISGGLGGLGQAIAIWLASRGARHVVLLTSSLLHARDSGSIVEQLACFGCTAQVEVCDVGDATVVEELVSSIKTPIGGVVHSALRLSVSEAICLSSSHYCVDKLPPLGPPLCRHDPRRSLARIRAQGQRMP